MNGPVKMYRLQPIIRHDIPVVLPDCMYRLKSIHGSRNQADGSLDHSRTVSKNLDIFEQVKQFLKNNQEVPGLMELAARQEQILKQLAELRNQIQSIKCELKIPQQAASDVCKISAKTPPQISTTNQLPESIVINANPSSPPYSIEIIQRLLQDAVTLSVSSYLHSSIDLLSENAKALADSLTHFEAKNGVPVVQVRIIWKNISSNAELVLAHSTPISGEVNILRYLSRASGTNLNYENDKNSFEIDSLLDQCFLLSRAKTKTERAAIVQSFNKSLGKSQFLTGKNKPTIADLAAYSAIRQSMVPSELGANIGKWYERCSLLVK